MTGFLGLDIALRSLMAHQQAMEIVSHNIANVNTPGYSRQRPVFTAEAAYYSAMSASAAQAGRMGMGVRLSQIRRMSADFITTQVRLEKHSYSKWAIIRDTLQQIEAIISEPSEGSLSAVMDEFWAAWRDLSVDPQSTALRANVYERGASLASTLNTYSEQLVSARRSFNLLINETVRDVNDIVQELAALNVQIVAVLAVGDQPNDLRDRRDLLLDTLAELVDVTVSEEENGATTVLLRGHHLVMGAVAGELATVSVAEDPTLLNIVFQDTSELVRIDGGKLAGIIEARDSVITDVLDDLDTIAATLVSQVNDVHAAGYGLDGVTGRDF
ncbi:MAG: flagellar hook-associated protein FlgK, partial [Anaerolineales bacterium]